MNNNNNKTNPSLEQRGNIQSNDGKKKVNGRDVSSKEDAETLFSENKNAVTLLVSRSLYTVSSIILWCILDFSKGKKITTYQRQIKTFKVVVDYPFLRPLYVSISNDKSKLHNRTHNPKEN